jgi:hypothetical protein
MRDKTCCIKKCNNKNYSNSFCSKHYQTVVKHGDPLWTNEKYHNMCGTPEYNAWNNMLQRCNNKKGKYYPYYGGRGIKILYKDFKHFYQDMGDRPENTSIDRIDNDGNYEPGNCRWATKSVQLSNRRPMSTTGYKYIYNDSQGYGYNVTSRKGYIGHYKTIDEAIKNRDIYFNQLKDKLE